MILKFAIVVLLLFTPLCSATEFWSVEPIRLENVLKKDQFNVFSEIITVQAQQPSSLNITIECSEDESCEWANLKLWSNFLDYVLLNVDETAQFEVHVIVPNDIEFKPYEFYIVVTDSERIVRIPYYLETKGDFNILENIIITFDDFLTTEIIPIPNEQIGSVYGIHILLISIGLIIIGSLMFIYDKGKK